MTGEPGSVGPHIATSTLVGQYGSFTTTHYFNDLGQPLWQTTKNSSKNGTNSTQRQTTQKPVQNTSENAITRVKKVYKEKGFWAAALAYCQEAFGGPPVSASKEEHEIYHAHMAYIDYMTK